MVLPQKIEIASETFDLADSDSEASLNEKLGTKENKLKNADLLKIAKISKFFSSASTDKLRSCKETCWTVSKRYINLS